MENKMMIYPKQDIKNVFEQVIYYKDQAYEAYKLKGKTDDWLVKCEMIGCEYPIVSFKFISDNFNFQRN